MNSTATRGQVEAHITRQRGSASRFSRRGALAAASATVLAILASAPALAEIPVAASADGAAATTPNSTVAEVVVTARRRGERVIDVPESLTAMAGDDLKKAGVDSLDDLGHMVPNVLFNRRGDNEPNVVIRGIGSFGNVQGVNFYFDEVPNFTDQASRLVDLDRVEVLKGPQGTLYGGAAIGGAVKYITRQPSDTFEGGIGAEVGQERTANINGWVNIGSSPSL